MCTDISFRFFHLIKFKLINQLMWLTMKGAMRHKILRPKMALFAALSRARYISASTATYALLALIASTTSLLVGCGSGAGGGTVIV